jgi:RecA-family ATPase
LFRDNKEPKWIVDRLIPEESISIIGGTAGLGKSFMTLDLAIEATQGGLWLGKYQTQKCNVLYIDEESSGSLLKDRFTKMIVAKNLQASEVPVRISLNKGIKFSNLLKLKTVRRLIEQYKPKLIIVDSLIKVNSGDENFSTAIAQFFEPIAAMTHEYGLSFLFIDHEGKSVYQADNQNREPSSNDLRGSNAKSAAVDAVFSLRSTKEGLRFYHTKSRFGEAILPITVRIYDEGTDRIFVRGY